jgi:TetR/AcrR family transcriptional repressor of nem operon
MMPIIFWSRCHPKWYDLAMPYPADHKLKTHDRIIEQAARLFRAQGYAATSVERLMAAAGLTHGGFYAHFQGKTELFKAALHHAFAQSRGYLLGHGLEDLKGDGWVRRAGRRYLSRSHRDAPVEGCAIPTLSAEVARADDRVRSAFGEALDETLAALAERLDGDRAAAIRLLATWAGAMSMARAVNGPLAEEILAACRPAAD